MSATESQPNKTGQKRPATVHVPATFANTNALLQKAIQQLPPPVRSQIILRCDELAALQIGTDILEKVFSQLLQMIIEEREANGQLFLHITCSKEASQEAETISNGLSRFLIQFHTNLSPQAAWMPEAESRINSLASLLLPFNGSLQVTQLKNSGCVFVITLPGK